jgi:hypothetical protein
LDEPDDGRQQSNPAVLGDDGMPALSMESPTLVREGAGLVSFLAAEERKRAQHSQSISLTNIFGLVATPTQPTSHVSQQQPLPSSTFVASMSLVSSSPRQPSQSPKAQLPQLPQLPPHQPTEKSAVPTRDETVQVKQQSQQQRALEKAQEKATQQKVAQQELEQNKIMQQAANQAKLAQKQLDENQQRNNNNCNKPPTQPTSTTKLEESANVIEKGKRDVKRLPEKKVKLEDGQPTGAVAPVTHVPPQLASPQELQQHSQSQQIYANKEQQQQQQVKGSEKVQSNQQAPNSANTTTAQVRLMDRKKGGQQPQAGAEKAARVGSPMMIPSTVTIQQPSQRERESRLEQQQASKISEQTSGANLSNNNSNNITGTPLFFLAKKDLPPVFESSQQTGQPNSFNWDKEMEKHSQQQQQQRTIADDQPHADFGPIEHVLAERFRAVSRQLQQSHERSMQVRRKGVQFF